MSHIPKVLGSLSRLLSYPDEHTVQTAELLFVVLQDEVPEAASSMAKFGAFVEQHETWEVEEAFTRVFDVNPACALEVGWHLFGEEYARGMFLVRMREEMRKYGLEESTELPDHLAHVLAIVVAMPDDEATRFMHACVLPAVAKMHEAVKEKETPYGDVVACLMTVLVHVWGEVSESATTSLNSIGPGTPGFQGDPLRSFPVADAGCESPCGSEPDLVQLEITPPAPDGLLHTLAPAPAREP
jgi:nitrate reductase molybdenum cofactor assembly chaperone